MDNVHYSELADFFHSWLSGITPFRDYDATATTRAAGEVQDTTADGFASSIEAVWRECHRVMKPEGLLAFTFHQAKVDGWVALMNALARAGFVVTAMHPIKGEMSVAAPKHGAREPSTLDTVVVCRKTSNAEASIGDSIEEAARWATDRLAELADGEVVFGPGDVRSVVRGCVLALLTRRDLDLQPCGLVEAADRLAAAAVEWFAS
jgi:adenine-specific DNA methylase